MRHHSFTTLGIQYDMLAYHNMFYVILSNFYLLINNYVLYIIDA